MLLRRLHPPASSSKINVTPLIDVVMCLIVFYLIVGKLAAESLAKVNLPASGAGLTSEAAGAPVITVTPPEGPAAPVRIVFDDRLVTPAQLLPMLKEVAARRDPPPVQLRADRRLTYGQLKPVFDACRDAGLPSVRLTTQRAGGTELPTEFGVPGAGPSAPRRDGGGGGSGGGGGGGSGGAG